MHSFVVFPKQFATTRERSFGSQGGLKEKDGETGYFLSVVTDLPCTPVITVLILVIPFGVMPVVIDKGIVSTMRIMVGRVRLYIAAWDAAMKLMPEKCSWILLGVAISLCFVFTEQSQAQDFERYRPLSPLNRDGGEAKLPKEPKPATGDDKILVNQWKAIVIVDHKDKVDKDSKIDASGVVIRGDLSMLANGEFHNKASRYLNGPITFRNLNELTREIILYYRANDQPVVDVSVPEQRITSGIVQIVVTEGRIGRVSVQGSQYFSPNVLWNQIFLSPGQPIYESSLKEELRWLNRSPYRDVSLELSPGRRPGTTDINFLVDDERPVDFYFGYEDTGTRATRIERLIVGGVWGNAFGQDDTLSYQYTADPASDRLRGHSFYYSRTTRGEGEFVLFGSYAELEAPDPLFTSTGTSWQISGRYYKSLIDSQFAKHRVFAGFDYKETDNNLDFGGVNVFPTNIDIFNMLVGYEAAQYGYDGAWSARIDLVVSPGEFSPDNSSTNFNQVRQGASTSYVYTRGVLENIYYLDNFWQLMTRATGQWSDSNLTPPEQLGFGGYNTIRGYDQRVVNGDSGYIFNLELQTRPRCLWVKDSEFSAHIFFDIGAALNHSKLPGEDVSVDLSSVGAGFVYRFSDRFRMRFDYGLQANRVATQNQPRERPHMSAIVIW